MITPRLRSAGLLLLAGQLLYIAATLFHAGGDANDHHAIFAAYAEDSIWSIVHVAQFAGVAVLVAGLFQLFTALEDDLVGKLGLAMAVVALATHAVMQATDGVALKQAVNAWHGAAADEASRFAAAESMRWLEWGMRSYHDYAVGAAMVLAAAAIYRIAPRPVAILAGLCGVSYLMQGWIAGASGFTPAQSAAIVMSWGFGLGWMIWLVLATASRRATA